MNTRLEILKAQLHAQYSDFVRFDWPSVVVFRDGTYWLLSISAQAWLRGWSDMLPTGPRLWAHTAGEVTSKSVSRDYRWSTNGQ